MTDQQHRQTPCEEGQLYGPVTHPQRLQRTITQHIETLRTTTEKIGPDHERTLSWNDLKDLLRDIKLFTEANHVTPKTAQYQNRPTELNSMVTEIWNMVTDLKTDYVKPVTVDQTRKTIPSYAEALRGTLPTHLQRPQHPTTLPTQHPLELKNVKVRITDRTEHLSALAVPNAT